MTSEGGGAVAYPVMTLALKIPSPVARDFSMMIQSCGKISFTFHLLNIHAVSSYKKLCKI